MDNTENDMRQTKGKIERKAAETILQRPFEVRAGGRTYSVAHPTVATLIMASEAISRLPLASAPDREDIVKSSLAIAPQCRALGEIAAVLILGAREAVRPAKAPKRGGKGRFRGFRRRGPDRRATAAEALARDLLEECSAGELYRAVAAVLTRMEIGDFFALTTFLTEINLLRPTKVAAGTEATASGR